jgi:hypothetical protein
VKQSLFLELSEGGTGRRAVQQHWQLVKFLCGGLDPRVTASDSEGSLRPVLDLMKVPKSVRRALGTVNARRYSISDLINDGQRRLDVQEKMAPIFIFHRGAWDHLTTGWELEEYKARTREMQKRAREEEQIRTVYGGLRNGMYAGAMKVKLAELRKQRPDDPEARDRSWDTWWKPVPTRDKSEGARMQLSNSREAQ